MDGNKVNKVLDIIEKRLREIGIEPVEADHTLVIDENHDRGEMFEVTLGHCLGMIPKMREFIEEDRMGKVFRWLGFMQGVFWAVGIYSVEEMKNHTRRSETG